MHTVLGDCASCSANKQPAACRGKRFALPNTYRKVLSEFCALQDYVGRDALAIMAQVRFFATTLCHQPSCQVMCMPPLQQECTCPVAAVIYIAVSCPRRTVWSAPRHGAAILKVPSHHGCCRTGLRVPGHFWRNLGKRSCMQGHLRRIIHGMDLPIWHFHHARSCRPCLSCRRPSLRCW